MSIAQAISEAAKAGASRGALTSAPSTEVAEADLRGAPTEFAWVAPPRRQLDAVNRNYHGALALLENAARALELLEDRRDQLEATLHEVAHRAENAVAAAMSTASSWQKVAANLETQNQDLERQLAAARQRAELAEAQRDAQRERAEAAERYGSDAEQLSQGFHAKILAAFGRGTKAHDILAAATDQRTGVEFMSGDRGASDPSGHQDSKRPVHGSILDGRS